MTKKVERSPAAIQRSAQPIVDAGQRARPATASVALIAPELPPHLVRQLSPAGGKPVAATATPHSLWTSNAKGRDIPGDLQTARAEIQRMTPEQRLAKIKAAKAERRELEGKIADRVEHLEKRFSRKRLATRTELVKEYLAAGSLPPEARQKIETLVAKADSIQQQIDDIRAQVKAGDPPGGRLQASRTLRALRAEQSQTVREMQAELTAAGLTVDLLAHVEDQVDPAAAADLSLVKMVNQWFTISVVISFFESWVARVTEQTIRDNKQRQEEDRIQADLLKRDLVKRHMLVELEKRVRLQGDGQAARP